MIRHGVFSSAPQVDGRASLIYSARHQKRKNKEAPRRGICIKFGTHAGVDDVIICDRFLDD